MSKKIQKFIFFTLIIIVSIWFLYAEISLFINTIRINRLSGNISKVEKFSFNLSNEYSLKFNVPSNIDLNKSYIKISGSNYISEKPSETYISFLDRIVVLEIIPLSSDKVRKLSETTYTYIDNRYTPEGFTSIVELFLTDKEGNNYYDWQLTSNSSGFIDLFISRYSYLVQYLIWIYAIFGSVISRKVFATIYDSVTKKPLSGVIVRFFKDKSLITTLITSTTGIIDEELSKGTYKLLIDKAGYTFPSKLKPLQNDGIYQNLYYGGSVNIFKSKGRLDINIPLDPQNNSNSINKSYLGIVDSAIQAFNPQLLIILSISQILVWPGYIETYIFAAVGFSLLLIQWLSKKKRVKKPGIVMDIKNHILPNIKINLYESEWNKLINSTVTNENGEYEFIVLPNDYYLKIESPNYKLKDKKDRIEIKKSKDEVMYINSKIIVDVLPTSRATTTTTTSTTKTNSTASAATGSEST